MLPRQWIRLDPNTLFVRLGRVTLIEFFSIIDSSDDCCVKSARVRWNPLPDMQLH